MTTGVRFDRRMAVLGAVVLFSCAYFYSAGGWNQNTRFDLVRAIVEQGTIRIDAYHENSGDKALANGHVYADKAPGASFAAVPPVWLVRAVVALTGRSTSGDATVIWLSYVATAAAGAVPVAIVALCVFLLARRMGASDDRAAIAALITTLGTPLWAYATVLWGHALTACCLMVAFVAADLLRDDVDDPKRDIALGGGVGLAAGWAVVTEFPAAIPAAILAALVTLTVWRQGGARRARVLGALAAGAVACAAVLMIYQWAAFGSPFHLGYASEESPELLQAGFFGITVPNADVMGELLWGSYRGLLPLAPALIVTPVGFWMAWRSPMKWTIAAVAICVVYYFLLNSAYEHWEGGWSYGPRQVGAILGCLGLGVIPVLMRGGTFVRAVVVALAWAARWWRSPRRRSRRRFNTWRRCRS
jgi:hypothetical protein